MIANEEIRNAAKAAGVKLSQVADRLGMHDSNFSKKLRKELSADERQKVLDIIKDIERGL